MKRSEKVYRNQVIITSIDEMIDENSVIRVIDAYVQSLDVERLGYHVYKNKTGRPAAFLAQLQMSTLTAPSILAVSLSTAILTRSAPLCG